MYSCQPAGTILVNHCNRIIRPGDGITYGGYTPDHSVGAGCTEGFFHFFDGAGVAQTAALKIVKLQELEQACAGVGINGTGVGHIGGMLEGFIADGAGFVVGNGNGGAPANRQQILKSADGHHTQR